MYKPARAEARAGLLFMFTLRAASCCVCYALRGYA